MRLGTNLAPLTYHNGTRAFWNLAASGSWQWQGGAGRLDPDGNVVELPKGVVGLFPLGMTTEQMEGKPVDLVLTWDGTATFKFNGTVSNIRTGGQSIAYTARGNVNLILSSIDPNDPPRNFDVREVDADRDALWHPTFLASLDGYSILRFMDWQNTNANYSATWEKRSRSDQQLMRRGAGVPLEFMVALANLMKADLWLCIPWNADADYVRNMAVYVRDNLAPGLRAFIENSNEVWNFQFPVTKQAVAEGKAANLATDDGQAMLRRYAQRSTETFVIWEDVFAGQIHRIVRVAAFQNGGAWQAKQALNFEGFDDHVDMLACAPYFCAMSLAKGAVAALRDGDFSAGLTAIFENSVPKGINEAIANAKALKAFADERGKGFITYEAGQHILSPDDVPQLEAIQRDPRMGDAYKAYLDRWKAEIGTDIVLFNDVTPITKFGAWGHREFIGQPTEAAPKAKAIEEWRLANLEPVTPPEPEKTALEQALDALDVAVAAVREAANN